MPHTPYLFQPFQPDPPSQDELKKHYISILHPGFEHSNHLFRLLAVDGVPETTAGDGEPSSSTLNATGLKYGIHHATLLDICCIIAENQPGFLSTTAGRGDRVDCDMEDVVFGDEYYYFLEDESLPNDYPIVVNFADWKFPARIPHHWNILNVSDTIKLKGSASSMSDRVAGRDLQCRISGYGDELKNAHIVPKAEVDWFNDNDMRFFNLNQTLSPEQSTQDVRNGMLLREDIHSALNRKSFVVVPKANKPVVHFLTETANLGMLYHNAIVDLPPGMRQEFWYARLAFNVFHHGPMSWMPNLHEHMQLVSQCDGLRMVKPRGPRGPPSRQGTKRSASSSQGETPPPKKFKAVEASSPGEEDIDEEMEYREEVQLQRTRFPSMSQEYDYTDDAVWNTITWYPGQKRFYRRVQQYVEDHPSVKAVAEPEKAVWDDPQYHE